MSFRSKTKRPNLSGEHNHTTSLFNLLLSSLGHQLSLNHDRLILGQHTFPQDLKIPESGHIDHRRRIVVGLCLHVLWDERPELVDVDDGAVKLVAEFVEVPHTHFLEIPRVVLVEEDPVWCIPPAFPRPPGACGACRYGYD
ncbi:hypothetical protein V6Z12_D02G188900 [Gossypium hirsutum]